MKRLTPAMKRKLVPYLPKLIRRFRALAEGREAPDCALCDATPTVEGRRYPDCTRCPVFGPVSAQPCDNVCGEYMPPDFAILRKADAQRVLDFLVRLKAKTDAGEVAS